MFITTTLPYIGIPHIGHAFEFVLADAISRAHKHLLHQPVHFNVGLDENGLKVWQSAQAQQVTVQELIAQTSDYWQTFCQRFHIAYDSFYKTSSPEHHQRVQQVWNILLAKDKIYKRTYSGQYCVGCEAYKTDKDLTDAGTCADHPTTPLQTVTEENYFFRLADYRSQLQQWLANSPDFLLPKSRTTELANLLQDADDISISRPIETCPWGVAVPNDPTQVVYVWFDALLNYIFAAGYPAEHFPRQWQQVVQLCGPDNLRFQAIIFQSFLAALHLPQTTHLLVHGTIVDAHGQKMSKSLGNGVDPLYQLDRYGIDAVRYYLLAGLSTYQTSSWKEDDLTTLYNAHVANDWGNLIARVLHLIDLKGLDKATLDVEIEPEFLGVTLAQREEVLGAWRNYEVRKAAELTSEIVIRANRYVNEKKVWASDNYVAELANLYHLLTVVNELYYPLLPASYETTKAALAARKKVVLFQKL